MHSRLARTILVVVAAAALAAAGIAVNVLLDYAHSNNDPIGKLTPRAGISQPSPPLTTQTGDRTDDSGAREERDD